MVHTLIKRAVVVVLTGGVSVSSCRGEAPPQVLISQAPLRGDCSFNRVLPHGAGQKVVLWTDEPHLTEPINWSSPQGLAIFDLAPEPGRQQPRTVNAGLRIAPIRWSANSDALFLRVGNHIGLIAGTGAIASEMRPISIAWRNVRVRAIRHGEIDFLTNTNLQQGLHSLREANDVSRVVLTLGANDHLLGMSTGDGLPLFRIEKGKRIPLKVSGVFVIDPMVLDGEGEAARLTYVGYRTDLPGGEAPRTPYLRPLVDFNTGAVIGRFGHRKLHIDAMPATGILAVERAIGRDWIIDAAFDGSWGAILVADENQQVSVLHGGSGDWQSTPVCTRHDFVLVGNEPEFVPKSRTQSQATHRVDVRYWVPTKPEPIGALPIGRVFSSSSGRKEQLVVYLHGGPGASLWNVDRPRPVAELMSDDTDILAVEYSGSNGAGLALSEALPRLGPAAIERDGQIVADWVRSQSYRRVYIVAESFGAAPALAMLKADPDLFTRAFFIAPLIRLREPEEWTGPGRKIQYTLHQRAAEHGLFGGWAGREAMRDWLHQHWASYSRRHDSFYFGARDPVSKLADFTSDQRRMLKSMELSGTNHAFISGRVEIWSDIRSTIERDRLGSN